METKTFPVNETITERRFRPVALVAGRNYCSILCMARSLGQAGYPVEVLRITETKPRTRNLKARLKPDACSKYVTKWTELITDRNAERIFTELARLADPSEKKLLVPVDDLVAEAADRHLDALKDRYYMANVRGEEGALAALMSKERQKELADLMARLRTHLIPYEGSGHILTDDQAPVELLGMKVIDELIAEEVGYYREIYKQEGLAGLLDYVL